MVRLQRAAVRALAALPPGAVRALAGRPIVIDGQRLDPQLQLGLKFVSLSEQDGPRTPAAARLETARSASVVSLCRPPVARVRSLLVAGRPARLYEPIRPSCGLLVFFHGGGFVVGDLDTHDVPCRFLCERSGVAVLSVDYRLGPEHRFPAAVDDALAAYGWAREHAGELGVDAERIAVGGDSAGGTLATVVARLADPGPALQVLIYPGTEWDARTYSRARFADGFLLTAEDIAFYREHYLPDDAAARDPRASPLLIEDLAGVAPAYILTAGFDPLRDEAEAYAERLAAAGVRVALRREGALIHGFLNAVCVSRAAALAVAELAGALRIALAR
jgi:acetyl esterase